MAVSYIHPILGKYKNAHILIKTFLDTYISTFYYIIVRLVSIIFGINVTFTPIKRRSSEKKNIINLFAPSYPGCWLPYTEIYYFNVNMIFERQIMHIETCIIVYNITCRLRL